MTLATGTSDKEVERGIAWPIDEKSGKVSTGNVAKEIWSEAALLLAKNTNDKIMIDL